MKKSASPQKRAPGRPKKESREDTVETVDQIILAAKRLFRQSGYAAVSINMIVEAVGLTKPTLYYYFKDKEALYAAVLCDMLKNGSRYVQQAINERDTVREKLLHLAAGYFEHSPTSISVVMRDAMEHLDPDYAEQVNQAYQTFIVSPFEDMLKTAVAQGELKPHDTKLMAHLVISLLDALLVSYTAGFTRNFPFQEAAKLMIDSFMDGITTV